MYDIKSGVWLDIFVYDYVCKDSQKEIEKLKKLESERQYYKYAFPVIFEKDKKLRNLPKTVIKYVMIFLLEIAQKRNTSLLMKYLKSKQLNYIDTARSFCEEKDREFMRCYKLKNNGNLKENILAVESFDKRILVPFEDNNYFVPENFHQVLVSRYGDYRELPPESERKQTHRWTKNINY